MKSIKVNGKETGWVGIPGNTKTIVVHYEDGHQDTMSLVDFLILRSKEMVVQIDCYTDDDEDNTANKADK